MNFNFKMDFVSFENGKIMTENFNEKFRMKIEMKIPIKLRRIKQIFP